VFTAKAMIHSLKSQDTVTILHEKNNNDVIAEYNGNRYTAIFNVFVCMYYVDDIYGKLKNPHECPKCGEHVT
jgi:hypothetical protein